jgi:hypothetical protein
LRRGRPRSRWEENVKKKHLNAIGWGGIEWFDVAQDMVQCKGLVKTVIKPWVQYNVWKFLSS